MANCVICTKELTEFISFGQMPIANGFLLPNQFEEEFFFELKVGFCPACYMVQLTELVDRSRMFHDNYAFYSSTSKGMATHFAEFAEQIIEKYLDKKEDPFVVEIGSNDGIMLRNFAMQDIRHLGVEPSKNVAEVARKHGIHTVSEFFDEDLAQTISDQSGKANAILGANVICHIPYINSLFKGVKILLADDGVFVYEDPYIGDIIEKTSYDQIYDEHAFYFSAGAVSNLAKMNGLELIDVIPQTVHGGSMRYVIGHQGEAEISNNVKELIEKEEEAGLYSIETYHQFRSNVEASRDKLMAILNELKDDGKHVVGYGATSKSTTVTNYCKIGPEHVAYFSDTTPIKQGKFSPGTHIPVKHYEDFINDFPDHALLFAWNHAAEIMEKEKEFMDMGGKWIVYVPEVKIIDHVAI